MGPPMFASGAQMPPIATTATCDATATALRSFIHLADSPHMKQKSKQGLLQASRLVAGGGSSDSQLRKESRGSPVLASTAALMSSAMLSAVLLSGLYGMVTTVP